MASRLCREEFNDSYHVINFTDSIVDYHDMTIDFLAIPLYDGSCDTASPGRLKPVESSACDGDQHHDVPLQITGEFRHRSPDPY